MIRIEIDDREVRRALEELRRRASNMTQAMHAIGQGLAEGSRGRILDGRDWSVPRVRGDEPKASVANMASAPVFPACAGMNRTTNLWPSRLVRVFPACAGMNRNRALFDRITVRVPRVRGDEPQSGVP